MILLAGVLLGVQLTLFQPRGADYAHHIIDCPAPGFENLAASLHIHTKFRTYVLERLHFWILTITGYTPQTLLYERNKLEEFDPMWDSPHRLRKKGKDSREIIP